MKDIIFNNIGTIFSGDISSPLLQGPLSLKLSHGKIARISAQEVYDADLVYDACGMAVCPGLIDSHFHPVFGEYTPRQNSIGYIESYLHGGITSMVSAGEAHLPGRPRDRKCMKALALLAHASFLRFRPKGVKVYAGALILSKGMIEEDFRELSEEGVWLIGETVGLGNVKSPDEVQTMVQWAKKYGMKVLMHIGGTAMEEKPTVTCDDVLLVNPDVVSHLNGGPTSTAIHEVARIISETKCAIEIVYCGNLKMALDICRLLADGRGLSHLLIGSDTPSGTGLIPLGMWRMICFISSMAGIPAEIPICCATGNTQRVFSLTHGTLTVGHDADILLIDAPIGSPGRDAKEAIELGDIPAIAMAIIDGCIRIAPSRNTPPPKRNLVLRL